MMKLLMAVVMSGLLFMACADRKDEAEKLGQEVMDQEAESLSVTDEALVDSSAIVEDVDTGTNAEASLDRNEDIAEAPSGEGYTVQVASCPSYEYAQYLVDLYRKRGYEPYMVRYMEDGTQYYRVRIGAFETLAEAKALQAELLDKYSLDTWVDFKSD